MPNINVVNMAGAKVGEIALSDVVFGAEVNEAVLHAAVRAYLLNQRQGTQSTLTRSEVSGGGRKPWKQKGTGRARQVQQDHHNGHTVVSHLVQSHAHTIQSLTRRLSKSLCSVH